MITRKATLAIFTGLIIAGTAYAADRDDHQKLGSTSSDSTDITLGIKGGDGIDLGNGSGSILIQGLSAISLGDFGANGAGDISNSSTFCVYRTGGGAGKIKYNITPTSTYKALVDKDNKNPIGYTMAYSNNVDAVNNKALTFVETDVTTTVNGTLSKSGDTHLCTGSNGKITVTADFSDVAAAPAGNYKDTLVLVVSPI